MAEYPSFPHPDELSQFPKGVKHHSTSITAEKPVYYAKKGIGSKEEGLVAITLPQLLQKAADKFPDKPALQVERPCVELSDLPVVDGKPKVPPSDSLENWKTWTYKGYLEDTKKFAKSLLSLGFKAHDSVGIYGFNSPEWALALMGTMFAGGCPAGIYPSDTGDQIAYKSDHSNGVVIAVDCEKTLAKVKPVVKDLTMLKAIVCWGTISKQDDLKNKDGNPVKIYSWDQFMALGSKVEDSVLQKVLDAQKPSKCACLVYTSGTTGNPKAVMLSHDAVIFAAYALCIKGLGDFGVNVEQERILSYLPLCHVAGMMVDLIAPLAASVYINGWVTVAFARPYDLKIGTLVERMQVVKPTLFLGVPRVWEKMAEKLQSVLGSATGIKAHLANWAMRQGHHYVDAQNFNHDHPSFGQFPSKGLLYRIADKLVLSKVRERLGLDCAKFCFTGAAPIQIETQRFMSNFGIQINEVYGMSEGCGGTSWSKQDMHLWGSVGPGFPVMDVKCFHVDDKDFNKKRQAAYARDLFHPTEEEQGEICFKGRPTMIGYLANPRLGEEHIKDIESKNAATIDDEGYLHTGDKAAMSKYGFLRITGRYKEIIIGAGGENIAPVPIEDEIKKLCPCVSNVVMIGDKRKFNVALVTLKLEGATGELPGTEKLLAGAFSDISTSSRTIDEAMNDQAIIKYITDAFKKTNANGKVCVNHAATIQKFMILPRDLSIVTGDFTPTLKLKRQVVADRFEHVIDVLYNSKDVYVKFPKEKFAEYFS